MLFEKKKRVAVIVSSISNIVVGTLLIGMILITMLLSNQFRYGAIVIATGSMTGAINQGDIIVYEQYDNDVINVGDVILFKNGESLIVHRVIEVVDTDGQIKYVTKGDANNDKDAGYRTAADIVGITNVKVPYFGYFTLWLREIIE